MLHEALCDFTETFRFRFGGYRALMAEPSDPLALFGMWLTEARQSEGRWSDALNLATASAAGRPSVRAVMLRGFDGAGLVFFSDEGSRKGRELAENPWAAASFAWPQRNRQVQLEGPVTRLGDREAEILFAHRPGGVAKTPGATRARPRRCSDRPAALLGGLSPESRRHRVLGRTA